MRAVAAGTSFSNSGVRFASPTFTTSVLRCSAMIWSCVSRSTRPKSERIWLTGLPERVCSCSTSSYCRSSISPRSLISASKGLELASDILLRRRGLLGWWRRFLGLRGLGHLVFDQLGLHGRGILRFSNHLFTRDHALHILVHQKAVQRYHAVLGARLNIGLDPEGFVITDQGGNGRSINHDFEQDR